MKMLPHRVQILACCVQILAHFVHIVAHCPQMLAHFVHILAHCPQMLAHCVKMLARDLGENPSWRSKVVHCTWKDTHRTSMTRYRAAKSALCWSKSRQWSSKDAKPSKERRLRLMMFCAVPVAIATWVPQVLRSHSGACYACATRRCHRFDRLSGVFRTYRSDSGGSALHARAHRRPPLFLARGRRAFVGVERDPRCIPVRTRAAGDARA